jgi:hypothetical protein
MSLRSRVARALSIAAIVVVCAAAIACAQGTARSMDIDLSPSSSAMGGASNAVSWGGATNYWGNPALLGYQRGISYEWERSRLVPGLPGDVHLNSEALRLGMAGGGVVLSGRPPGIGYRRLDYGRWPVDLGGTTLEFHSYEKVDSWGFGVSALQALDGLRGVLGRRSVPWSRYGDLSFGMNFKRVVIHLAPSNLQGVAEGATRDVGLLARVTLTELLKGSEALPFRVDVTYGWSTLNSDDTKFVFINEDLATPPTRHQRNGVAVRIGFDPPGWTGSYGQLRNALGILVKGLSPLVALGAAADWSRLSAGGDGSSFHTSGQGIELTLANVLTGRCGHYQDRTSDLVGFTWGWGVGLPFGTLGGVRYDWASFPQAANSGLPNVTRNRVVAWVDPLAAWSAVRPAD